MIIFSLVLFATTLIAVILSYKIGYAYAMGRVGKIRRTINKEEIIGVCKYCKYPLTEEDEHYGNNTKFICEYCFRNDFVER